MLCGNNGGGGPFDMLKNLDTTDWTWWQWTLFIMLMLVPIIAYIALCYWIYKRYRKNSGYQVSFELHRSVRSEKPHNLNILIF